MGKGERLEIESIANGQWFNQSRLCNEDSIKPQKGTSLVVQWLRIHLPMQGTQVQSLVRKIPHATEQLGRGTASTGHLGLCSAIGEAAALRSPCSETGWLPFAPTRESPQKAMKTQWSGSLSVVCDSLQLHGLSMEFSRPESWSG